jgi:serine/threonine protein kinase
MSSKTLLNSTKNRTIINNSSSSEVDNLTGTVVLEKYTLLNRISNPSGEAAIYMAINNISPNASVQNSPVAVKIYRRKDAVKPEVLNKIAKLKSPGIVEIIDHGFYNGYPCIVMPYYMNGSLAGKTLSYDVIKDIVIPEVTEGLKYLHQNGIIHKDIKPANLMISNDGTHIHIIDFGISSAKDDGVSILITKTGMSPEYCAPETFNNVWVEESDFYSFGITLFELFKGHTPYNTSSDKGELAANASIQKIPFSLDFPADLINLIKGLTYKDLSNRNDANNPNRRWTWREIEKWLKGEKIPVPGESLSGNEISNSVSGTDESSAFIFSKPYDFRNNQGKVVKLNNLSEFTEAFGLNWNDGKKHVGRGFASKFFIQQDMQNIASIIMDCEDAGVTDIAYAKMLVELGASTENYGLYWNSNRVDGNMKDLSDRLTEKLYNKRNDLNEEFENIKQLLCFWYEISGKTKELDVIKKLQKIAETSNQDIHSQVIALCSFIDSNMAIKIGRDIFQNIDELITFTQKQKNNNEQQYFEWVHNNQNHIKKYTECINLKIKNYSEILLKDWLEELNRRKEQERKQREEQERKQREEQERKQREEQERKQREEQERKQREEQERKQREEQERKRREEQERKQREEQERRQRELQAIIKKGIRKGMIIPFGAYPQDNDSFRTSIEWLVLDVKGNEALLISRYGLDCKQYHKYAYDDITWEDCDLRKWLNSDFLKSAFSNEESERILVSELRNDDNPEYYGTTGGNDTKDRIFCLSIAEAEQYFSSYEDRQCRPTAYARKQGAYVSNDCCYWWLRSPGHNQDYASGVNADGSLHLGGYGVDGGIYDDVGGDDIAVRPALRIIFDETLEQRKQREEEERRQREEQERKQREEQERKQREEQERRQKELLAQAQAHEEFSAIIKKGIRKGMIIPFGAYPQDNDSFRTPIEWLVLDVKVKKTNFLNRVFAKNKLEVLLISRYALDCKQYHHESKNITWEDCDLRKWLNSDFLKSAFSNEESERILVSELRNDDNPKYGTRGGNDTKDRIFCLSIAEAEQYFSSDKDRKCRPTTYAREQGANVGSDCCVWWLRSPGNDQSDATLVGMGGALHLDGDGVNFIDLAVRPALRIICNL